MTPSKLEEPDNPCAACLPAKCCLYTAIQVQGPRSKADFDDMFWHISHEGIEYVVEKGKWYMMIRARCSHLSKENRCKIYPERFRVCRGHPADNCEYHSAYGFDEHFKTYEELKAYAERRWRRFGRKSKRTRGSGRSRKQRDR